MDIRKLGDYGRFIEALLEGTVSADLDRAMDRIFEAKDWEVAAHVLVSASEVSAVPLVRRLMEEEAYEPLVWAACMRRQLRRGGDVRSGNASRVFRDWDAEQGGAGIPEHIAAEAEEIARNAEASRAAMQARAAEVDRDPIRDTIVTRLADKMVASPDALEAMLTIVRASGWEETRRSAAMKCANQPAVLSRLALDLRTADLLAVCRAAGLSAVSANVARVLGPYMDQLIKADDKRALELIAANHPEEEGKAAARQALGV